MAGVRRFVIIRHPPGVEPGTLFPVEYENEWFDREECGLRSRVLVINPATLCFPVGIKLRRTTDGAIADVYEPRVASLSQKQAIAAQQAEKDPED